MYSRGIAYSARGRALSTLTSNPQQTGPGFDWGYASHACRAGAIGARIRVECKRRGRSSRSGPRGRCKPPGVQQNPALGRPNQTRSKPVILSPLQPHLLHLDQPIYKLSISFLYDWFDIALTTVKKLTMAELVLVAVAACAGLAGLRLVRRVWFSPISHIPGPLLAKCSRYWTVWQMANNRRWLAVHELFGQHGPVVWVGPHNVASADCRSLGAVYQAKLDKVANYEAFSHSRYPNTFATM